MDILSDENCEGQTRLIFYALERLGLGEVIGMRRFTFAQAGLEKGSNDETVWQFCQTKGYLLLTGNRTAKGDSSLEVVLQRLLTEKSLPVLTIGDVERVNFDAGYCERCAESIATIVWDIIHYRKYRGTPRVYVPRPTV